MRLGLAFAAIFAIFFQMASCANIWPKETECGKLNMDYFYKTTNITDFNEFPWTARVGFRDYGDIFYKCSAVLINQRYLVSVASCFDGWEEADHVVLGDWNPTNQINEVDCNSAGECAPLPKKYKISNVIPHPDFNQILAINNLALLRLNDLVQFDDYISPICMPLPMYDYEQYIGEYLPYGGFARDEYNVAAYKIKTLLHVMSLNRCQTVLEGYSARITDNHICGISHTTENVLLSGSALMSIHNENDDPKRFFLLGIMSYGDILPATQIPDVFVRISKFRDWINSNILE